MCSAFTLDSGFDNSTIILIGDVFCLNTKCSGKLCLHKRSFQSLSWSGYQCPQGAFVCQVRNIPFEDETISFFLSLGWRVYFFEETPKSIQDVNGDVYCPGKYCFNREKCESLDGYVTTPRSIYAFGKCGAWLFVQKVPFMLQENVKTTKTAKTRFFLAKKRWTWYPTQNCWLMPHFYQPNIERKNCVWTTKYNRLLEVFIFRHVELKNVFTFQPIKLVSTTVKSAKPAATFWIFVLRTKNRQLCCLAEMVHIVLQERRVATTKKKNHLHFWRNFSANHNQAHPDLNQKNRSFSIYGVIVSTTHWSIELTKTSFTLSFYTLSVKLRATCFSQSPTTVLSGL